MFWYRCGSGSRAAKQAWQHVRQHAEPSLSLLHMSSMPPIVRSQRQAGCPLRAALAGAGWRFRAEVVAPLDTSSDSIESRRAAVNLHSFGTGDTQRFDLGSCAPRQYWTDPLRFCSCLLYIPMMKKTENDSISRELSGTEQNVHCRVDRSINRNGWVGRREE